MLLVCRAFSGSPPPYARRERRAYRVGRSTLAALRGLFPTMDEKVATCGNALWYCCIRPADEAAKYYLALQVVVDVLDSCGNNIDEAIKRLGDLQLSLNGSAEHAVNNSTPFPSPPLSPPPEPRQATGPSSSETAVSIASTSLLEISGHFLSPLLIVKQAAEKNCWPSPVYFVIIIVDAVFRQNSGILK